MSNGSNEFDVSYSQISWLEKILKNHPNTSNVNRTRDIQFDIERKHGGPVRLICLNEYTCGLSRIYEVLEEFPGADIIYVGGNWNGYTTEAKEFCLQSNLGLYISSEINGALHREDYWTYHRVDKDKNPIYPTRNPRSR